ncbi:MAG: T9SS type A sorting domain-containing protein [Bacteroidetes bacterium]|nr:T9SS type A sorting domain-containing protein [Bacteroidota bacterium]
MKRTFKTPRLFAVLVFLSLVIFGKVNAQVSFTDETIIASVPSILGVACADFNCDGKKDIVFTSSTNNTITVCLNTTTAGSTTPSFTAGTNFNTGTVPQQVIAADFNGDGKPDIVVAHQTSTYVKVFFNTTTPGASTPTFSSGTTFTTGSFPAYLTYADINCDGKLDIVVANSTASTVSVLRNTTSIGSSTPSFATQVTFATGSLSSGLTTADINNDGLPDIIVTNQLSSTVSVLLNKTTINSSTISFAAKVDFTTGTNPIDVSTGDFNHDGLTDLLVTNFTSGTYSVLLNTTAVNATTPVFSPKTDFTASPQIYWGKAADINNDGLPDIVGGGSVFVYLDTTSPGSSSVTFHTKKFLTASSVRYGECVDLNGDGKLDFVGISTTDVKVIINTMTLGATASFGGATVVNLTSSANQIDIADLNLDGKPDVVVSMPIWGIATFLNTTPIGASTPTFAAAYEKLGLTSQYGIVLADVNLDGQSDIISSNNTSGNFSVFMNTMAPGATTAVFGNAANFTVGTNPRFLTTGDFNGDGKPDVVVANNGSSNITVCLNTTTPGSNTASFGSKDIATDAFPNDVTVADFNGDGKVDIAVGINNFFEMQIFLNTTTPGASTPTFSAATTVTTTNKVVNIASGDINGDGKPDIITVYQTGVCSVFLNNTTIGSTTPSFPAKTDFFVDNGRIKITDINGDGKPDILLGGGNGSLSLSCLMNTTSTGTTTPIFSKSTISTSSSNSAIGFGDINLDGTNDLISASIITAFVRVYLNSTVIPLPVELTSFVALTDKQNVTLNWSTVQEENNKGFEIERNSFGAGWKRIGYIEGHGTTNTPQNYTFTERGLTTGSYHYRLKQIDYNGNYEYHELNSEIIIGVPSKFALAQNYPNPFNPSTIINYQLANNSFVSIKIFDISGREVSSLVNEVKDAGYYSVQFDAKSLPSGTYFYKLSTDKFSDVKKMVVVK